MSVITKVYFVRHARPDLTVKNELRPLTVEGILDSKKVTKALRDKNISIAYSSPYLRSIQTIKDFAENKGLQITLIDDFRERSVGAWVEDFRSYSRMQWEDYDYKLDSGESLREVQERNASALNKVIEANQGKNIVIGTHGTALSTIINYYNPSFGYDDFWKLVDKMPYILCFSFRGLELQSMEEIQF